MKTSIAMEIAVARDLISSNLSTLGVIIEKDDPDLIDAYLENNPFLEWMTHEEQLLYAAAWAKKLGSPKLPWDLMEEPGWKGRLQLWLRSLVRRLHPNGRLAVSALERDGIGGIRW